MTHDYELIVIGSGPAGRRAAIQAAKLGKSVLVVEGRCRVGGVSVHTGTIPSKTLRETALNLSGWRERGFYGRSYRVKKEIGRADLDCRLGKTLDHEVDVLEHQFLRNGVATMAGFARFTDANRIVVDLPDGRQQTLSGERFLIAVGTAPFRPDKVAFNSCDILDSDEIVELPRMPRSLTVVGAGVIGIEYATIFSALDVAVTVIEPRETMLDFVDREIVDEFIHQLRDRGMRLHMGAEVKSVAKVDRKVVTRLADGRSVGSKVLLFCAGRIGATGSLGLDACGLEADERGRIAVDPATFQTAVPHIYAAGDVIGFPSLASTSMEQGRIMARIPPDLPPGEYRSHFSVVQIPPGGEGGGFSVDDMSEQSASRSVGVRITPRFGISIPVIVRVGETTVQTGLRDLAVKTLSDGRKVVALTITRSGTRSAYGDITVMAPGQLKPVAIIKGIGVYPEVDSRPVNVPIDPKVPASAYAPGAKLMVTYTDDDYRPGEILARQDFVVP